MSDSVTFRSGLSAPMRMLLWLGLAVATWLLLVPTTSLEGQSCGVPLFTIYGGEGPIDRPSDCLSRNETRGSQAFATLVLTGVLAMGAAVSHWWRSPNAPSESGGGAIGALRRQHDDAP